MKPQSITSLPLSPEVERRARMVKYSLAMGVRVLCLVSLLFVRGWWMLIPALGAIFLPYFAVIIANVSPRHTVTVARPGALLPAENQTDSRDQERNRS